MSVGLRFITGVSPDALAAPPECVKVLAIDAPVHAAGATSRAMTAPLAPDAAIE